MTELDPDVVYVSRRFLDVVPRRTDHRAAFDVLDALLERYGEKGRHYHRLGHIVHTLRWADLHDGGLNRRERVCVTLALLFHDAVYDVGGQVGVSNEERSALFAESVLEELGFRGGVVYEVGRLVRLTEGHVCQPGDKTGGLVLDADLSVLGGAAESYDGYVSQIRKEYALVSDADWKIGRARVLRSLLGKEQIYSSSVAGDALEARARANMERELAALEKGD